MQRFRFKAGSILVLMMTMLVLGSIAIVNAQDVTTLNLTWWGSQSRHDRTIAVVEMYEAAHPDVDIVYEFAGFSDYWVKLNTQAAGGELACVMQHDYAYIAEWANRGLLAPMEPFFESGAIDLSTIDEELLAGGQIEGQTYGIPLGTNSPAFIIDADAFEAAGLELPATDWTWADFEEIALKLHEELGIYAISYGLEDPQFWRGVYVSLGGWIFNEAGTALGYEDDQPLVDYFSMISRLIEAGAVADGESRVELSAAGVEGSPIVTSGEAIRYQWSNQVVAVYAAAGEGRNLVLHTLPRVEGGESQNYLKPSMFFSVTADCPTPDLAADFVNFFVNDLEANEVLLAERGVPLPGAVRDHLRPMLDPVAAATFDFIELVAQDAAPLPPPEPQGWTDISSNVYGPMFMEPILYGQMSVEDAVALLRDESNLILEANE